MYFILKKRFIVCYFPFEILILKYCSLFRSIHVIWFVWQDVTCSECDMLGKWHIDNVECGMYGMWDVGDVGCSGCGMCRMWDVRDVGCFGCGMWDVGCLPRCRMLIYKMPLLGRIFLSATHIRSFYLRSHYISNFSKLLLSAHLISYQVVLLSVYMR